MNTLDNSLPLREVTLIADRLACTRILAGSDPTSAALGVEALDEALASVPTEQHAELFVLAFDRAVDTAAALLAHLNGLGFPGDGLGLLAGLEPHELPHDDSK